MNNPHYPILEQLVDEYEEDAKTIREDKMIMLYYPKLFTMSVASSFEHRIKLLLGDFIQYSCGAIQATYPKLYALSKKGGAKPLEDKIYTLFIAYEKNGVLVLQPDGFYELFGGQAFKCNVKSYFEIEKEKVVQEEQVLIDTLSNLLEQNAQYEDDYAKHSDIKERLKLCEFEEAEKAYLTLKYKRNMVAHDFVHGLSDSFEDIRGLYYDAVFFVIGLEKAILDITNVPT